VIAFRGGGALETMVDGRSCRFFDEQTVGSLVEALDGFDDRAFSQDACRENALRFSIDGFKQQFGEYVQTRWDEHTNRTGA